VDLHFYLCHLADVAAFAAEHQGYRWRTARELAELKFPEANAPVIELLLRTI
jgi:hypothetical protein